MSAVHRLSFSGVWLSVFCEISESYAGSGEACALICLPFIFSEV